MSKWKSEREREGERRRERDRKRERETTHKNTLAAFYLSNVSQEPGSKLLDVVLHVKFHFSVAEIMLLARYVRPNTFARLSCIRGQDLHHHTDLLRYLMEFISVILCGFGGLFLLCMAGWREYLDELAC